MPSNWDYEMVIDIRQLPPLTRRFEIARKLKEAVKASEEMNLEVDRTSFTRSGEQPILKVFCTYLDDAPVGEILSTLRKKALSVVSAALESVEPGLATSSNR